MLFEGLKENALSKNHFSGNLFGVQLCTDSHPTPHYFPMKAEWFVVCNDDCCKVWKYMLKTLVSRRKIVGSRICDWGLDYLARMVTMVFMYYSV